MLRISPLLLAVSAAACQQVRDEAEVTRSAPMPADAQFRGVETRLLGDDLVQFVVVMGPDAERAHVERYAECAAARYALIRGYGFARHVRTNVTQAKGGMTGDAVYTISPGLPQGLKTIDAEVAVASCEDNGIPTV